MTHIVFLGDERVAYAALPEVLRAAKARYDQDPTAPLLIFEVETGRQVDFDLRGGVEEVVEREAAPPRGVGRPRLGVVGREVSLLPRHWEWLEAQPSGASAALRRLVEAAIRAAPEQEQARRIRAALSPLVTALAGDRPNYEEVQRAIFAGDTAAVEALTAAWPSGLGGFVRARAAEAARLDAAGGEGVTGG